jgi:hypothetical protein
VWSAQYGGEGHAQPCAVTFVSLSHSSHHRVSVFRQKNTPENPTFSHFFWVAAQTLMDVGSEVWKVVDWDITPLLSLMPLSY